MAASSFWPWPIWALGPAPFGPGPVWAHCTCAQTSAEREPRQNQAHGTNGVGFFRAPGPNCPRPKRSRSRTGPGHQWLWAQIGLGQTGPGLKVAQSCPRLKAVLGANGLWAQTGPGAKGGLDPNGSWAQKGAGPWAHLGSLRTVSTCLSAHVGQQDRPAPKIKDGGLVYDPRSRNAAYRNRP